MSIGDHYALIVVSDNNDAGGTEASSSMRGSFDDRVPLCHNILEIAITLSILAY